MQNTENIIKESGLEVIDKDDVYGDVVYLERKKLIGSIHPVGMTYPLMIMINVDGIDAVDIIMDQSLEALRNKTNDDTKRDLQDILNESNPNDKIHKFINYVKNRPELFVSIVEKIIGSVLTNTSKPT